MSTKISHYWTAEDTTDWSRGRVLIIGLDAATFDLIKPWAVEGKLPNLANLLEKGGHGNLASVPNLNSISAWTSFATGVNPGKHGIYWFYERKPDSYDIRFLSGNDVACKRFWEIISEAGRRVGVINVPMTYPARPINGFLIAGLDAPSENCLDFTYPPNLYRELKRKVCDYQIDTNILGYARSGRLDLAIKVTYEVIEKRAKVVNYLMESFPWDLFIVVFTALDRIQHTFWRYMDPTHPHYNPVEGKKYGKVIENFYRLLDEVIGDMLKKVDVKTTIIILSDHGAGFDQMGGNFLNPWLESLGLFCPVKLGQKSHLSNLIQEALRKGSALADGWLTKRTRRWLVRLLPGGRAELVKQLHRTKCDWARTKAYADYIRPSIWINLKGREPQGIVEPGLEYDELRDYLIERLSACRDVETGKRVVKKVYRREERYQGPYLENAPDLLIDWNYEAIVSGFKYEDEHGNVVIIDEKSNLVERRNITGDHRPDGIFVITGPYIKKGQEIKGINIVDIAPTVLYLMGQPIPGDMDGKVITDVFKESFLTTHPVEYSGSKITISSHPRHILSPKEKKEIEERLRGLGYLG